MSLICMVPAGVCGYLLSNSFLKLAEINNEVYETSGGLAEQALNSIRTVSYLNGKKKENEKYGKSMEGTHKPISYLGMINGAYFGGLFFFLFANFSLNIWYGGHLIRQNPDKYSGGDCLTVMFALLEGVFSLGSLSPAIKSFLESKKALGRLIPLMNRIPSIDVDNKGGLKKDKLEGKIQFKDVSFAYPTKPDMDVLNKINFTINQGEKVALVGESGCGKTTITYLIERFYDVKSGSLQIDGEEIRSYNISWLRHNIAYVGQEPVLFATSILDNIIFAKEGATKDEAIEAAKKANAYDFIMNMDKKFNTYVGIGGIQLSGGQKQRLAIARAILKNASILILDEATSALDRKNEAEIQKTLDEISVGRTTIVIAHRLSTIINSDKILVFSKGSIIQEGSHEELIKIDGKYQALQKHQLIEEKESENEENINNDDDLDEVNIKKFLKRFSSKISSEKSKSHSVSVTSKKKKKEEEKEKEEKLLKKYTDGEVYSKLFSYMSDYKLAFFFLIFFSFIQGTIFPQFALFLPRMLDLFADAFSENYSRDRNIVMAEFMFTAFSSFISRLITGYLSSLYGAVLAIRLRKSIYKKYLEMHIGWHDEPKNNPGTLSAKLSKDVLLINKLIADLFSILAEAVSALFLGILISLIVSWRIGVPLLLTCPILILVGILQEKLAMGFSLKSEDSYTGSAGMVTESLTNMKTVVSFSREQELIKIYEKELEEPKKLTIKKSNTIGILYGLSQFSVFSIYSFAYYIGIYNIDKGHVTFKEMYMCLFGIMGGAFGAGMASQYMPDLGKANIACREIMEIMDMKPLVKNINEDSPDFISEGKEIQGEIEFRNVNFSYPSRDQKILNNFSLKIEPQTKVAIVGPSGCGKSTLMQLLLRFYNIDSGEIFLDGINIVNYDINYLRSQYGVVAQEPVLFSGTIEENIK